MVNRPEPEPSPDTSHELAEMSAGELLTELTQVEHSLGTARRPEPAPAFREPDTPLAGWQELAVLAAREEQILHELRRRSLIDLAGAS